MNTSRDLEPEFKKVDNTNVRSPVNSVSSSELSRRRFIQGAALTGASAIVPAATMAAPIGDGQAVNPTSLKDDPHAKLPNPIVANFSGGYWKASIPDFQSPKRPMGSTGLQISILGVGGYHLGTVAGQDEVNNMVAKALDHGINFFDNAWEYHGGMSEERVGTALKGKRDKAIVMTKVCTHGRKKDFAMRMLEESLRRLQTDHLDVWQVHEVIYYNDPEKAYDKDGVIEALAAAKQQGKVRFVGFTGHKNPSIHLEMLNRGFAFDTVQMPINPFDPSYRSFEQQVLPCGCEETDGSLFDEEYGWLWRTHRAWSPHSDGGIVLRYERARGLDHRVWHGFDGSARSKSPDLAKL
jgi:predicted oxidoreductase